MKAESGTIRLSATDLSNHLVCHHLTANDLGVALGKKEPPRWKSPDTWVLEQHGFEHEQNYVNHLAAKGLSVVDLREHDLRQHDPREHDLRAHNSRENDLRKSEAGESEIDEDNEESGGTGRQRNKRNLEDDSIETAAEKTLAAMKAGADVIVQGTLCHGRWLGRADILRRTSKPSSFGPWSYEVYDCKLARDTKAGTILQLSLYSELLALTQGTAPDFMYVVPRTENFEEERYRVVEYGSYYRQVKSRLERAVENVGGLQLTYPDRSDPGRTYPEPNAHCEICKWGQECQSRWRRDDHLSLVAGIARLQRKQFAAWNADTVERLAALPLPLRQKPERGSQESYVHSREQARVQVAGRDLLIPIHELIEVEPGFGLARLPQPSPGDLYIDIEGDPFVGTAGLEYLFGVVSQGEQGKPVYEHRWARNQTEEKAAYEWLVDIIMDFWSRHPDSHVYHFGAYEPATLKRLMGRYASREDAIDRMLRGKLFVDLHSIVRQGIRASVEQYGLKNMEPFYGFHRQVRLNDATYARRTIEHSLELSRSLDVWKIVQMTVEGYNQDDCLSLIGLQEWLEQQRTAAIESGREVPRPKPEDAAPPPSVDERQQRVEALFSELTRDVPVETESRTEEQSARWLLANLLDWHRREGRAEWWEYYRLAELSDEELMDEKSAISLLRFVQSLGVDGRSTVDRYEFDAQETDVRCNDEVHHKGERVGTVHGFDPVARTIDIKKTTKMSGIHPRSIYSFSRPNPKELAESLFRLGLWVQAHGLDGEGPYRAARDLLLRRGPRLLGVASGSPSHVNLVQGDEDVLGAATRLAPLLDSCVLAVQGPPGAGKTYTGARMICELARQGKRVGITALSHKVIRNLMEEVTKAAEAMGLNGVRCLQKVNDLPDVPSLFIKEVKENAEARSALRNGEATVVGGTAWLWSREDFFESVDVLFVDEAGQMSLANVLAVAQAAKSLVLLGDPQQLEQPLKGTHPDGAEASALEHLLAGAKTIPSDRGLFLPQTWRLHPSICAFTSALFYEDRLESVAGLQQQKIQGHDWLGEDRLWFIPVEHEGNQNSSQEEAARIEELVRSLAKLGVSWVDKNGRPRQLELADILIVTPYNAQVFEIAGRLPGARVGTVDKFQGQEAPVVIYSLTTSSPDDAPRGMEFLYSSHRFNVATSRARALCIVVGSPRLFEPECRSPRQMQLANAFCRYMEMGRVAGETATGKGASLAG